MRQYSIAKARLSLSHLINNLEPGERITITRRGKTVAVLLTPDDYAHLAGEQRRSWWQVIEQFRQQGNGVALDDQEIDSWRDRSPPREDVW